MAMQPTPAALQQQPRMRLANITRGRVEKPPRVLIYGVEGIGKSTFGAGAPGVVFIPVEDGTAHLDVARFDKPTSWQDVLDAIEELTIGQHDFKTVAIDTIDALEVLCWAHVVAKKNDPKFRDLESFGYGKGYTAALDEWRVLLAKLERLWVQRGMTIVLIAHSWIKTFKNPEDEDFDRYQLKLHEKAGGAIRDWCDAVLFARYETFANTDGKTKRTRGVSTGARVLHTQRTAAFDAKNRYDLPETIPLDWEAFAAGVKAHAPADPAALRLVIGGLIEELDSDERKAKATAALKAAGDDASKLARIADKLKAAAGIKAQGDGT